MNILLLVLLGYLCAAPVANAQPQAAGETPADVAWELSFSDGSNNVYLLRSPASGSVAMLEYRPVKPAESSSLVYSGGTAKTAEVSRENETKIKEWVCRLASDTGLHAPTRMMGTGAFRLKEAARETQFIIGAGDELTKFIAFLSGLLRPSSTP